MDVVRPSDLSAIEHEFARTTANDLYCNVLVVTFRGTHRAGAAGADDARTVEAFVGLGLALWHPDALVLDLDGLDYPGGSMLRGAMSPVAASLEDGFPFYVVASEANRFALAQALPEPAIVGSLAEAIERIATTGPWAAR